MCRLRKKASKLVISSLWILKRPHGTIPLGEITFRSSHREPPGFVNDLILGNAETSFETARRYAAMRIMKLMVDYQETILWTSEGFDGLDKIGLRYSFRICNSHYFGYQIDLLNNSIKAMNLVDLRVKGTMMDDLSSYIHM